MEGGGWARRGEILETATPQWARKGRARGGGRGGAWQAVGEKGEGGGLEGGRPRGDPPKIRNAAKF